MPLALNKYGVFFLPIYVAIAFAVAEISVAQESRVVIPAVTVAVVKTSNLRSHIYVDGTVVAHETDEIYPQISNTRIREVLVDMGDTVKTGDVLLRLDDRRLKFEKTKTAAEVDHAKATVDQSKGKIKAASSSFAVTQAILARRQKLVQSGNAPTATLEVAQLANTKAESALESAQDALLVSNADLERAIADDNLAALNLEYTTVTAHAAGMIAERNAVVGGIATMGSDPLFKIIHGGILEVEVQVFESSFIAIDIGDEATFKIAGAYEISGKVNDKEAVIDNLTRMGSMRIALLDTTNLQIGLSAHGTVVTESRTGLTVPATALGTDETGEYVYKVVDGTVRKQPVTTGILFEGDIEIRSGLSEGETVLARAGAFFRDGDAVRPVSAKDDAGTEKSLSK
jgi:HlyD family secretion protein